MDAEPIERQVSAGGVAFRDTGSQIEVALISVGPDSRWQLPKGMLEPGEEPPSTAQREVHEETGLETRLLGELETIEYWYSATRRGQRRRFHKFVHFYLMQYLSGGVADHDHEVNEARWFEIDQAITVLSFANEKKVVQMAKEHILSRNQRESEPE